MGAWGPVSSAFFSILLSRTAANMRWQHLIWPALVMLTLAVFWQTRRYEFINFDDDVYVTDNPHVRTGLSGENIHWAFTATPDGNWIPLVWLSLMLDAQLSGLDAGRFHLTNVLLHTGNVLLLFAVLWQMTGAAWKSAFVAALFAVHPLHVESVVWITERKDVLSTFFGFAALWAYASYVRQPAKKIAWYVFSLVAFLLSLMSKQMLVTLPFLLLLLDYWPLERLSGTDRKRRWQRLLAEKAPFFALTALFCAVAFWTQRNAESVQSLTKYSLVTRCLNSILVYVLYLGKMVWPHNLAIYYPHPGNAISLAAVSGAGALLVVLTAAAVSQRRSRPYVLVGWLWYLGTLLPVIGLVQIGEQQMADRYTYVPLAGPMIAVTWLVPSLVPKGFLRKYAMPAFAVVALAAFSWVGWVHTGYWKSSETLFGHALAVTENNARAHVNFGIAMSDQGRLANAAYHFRQAVRINPKDASFRVYLGAALADQHELDEALAHFQEASKLNPKYALAYVNQGNVFISRGKLTEAIALLHHALRLEPNHGLAHFNLGLALYRRNELDEARKHYERALALDPQLADAHNGLGLLWLKQGRRDLAVKHFREALRINPGLVNVRESLRRALGE